MMRKQKRVPFKESSRGFSNNLTVKLLYALTSRLKTPLAKRMKSQLLRGNWDEILSFSIDPSQYSDPRLFGVDYLLCEIASKVPPAVAGSTPERLVEVALNKFNESEVQCLHTNLTLPAIDSTAFMLMHNHGVREVFHLARKNIARLLGEFDWNSASALFGFGPGASTRLNRSRSDLYYKFGPKPDTTLHSLALAGAACGLCPLGYSIEQQCTVGIKSVNAWGEQLLRAQFPTGVDFDVCAPRSYDSYLREVFNVVHGSKLVTVPKNAKTDRMIAIEPCMNMYLQKGIGGLIRRALKRVDINLDSQERNQLLAKAGSIDGSLATIDLKQASDCVSRRVVEELLPGDWYRAMDSVRSKLGVLSTGWVVPYQKFSSMGNGFTFELESLIFWALSKGVAEYLNLRDGRIAVYGDDIIFPTQGADFLIDVLRVAGFTPNLKKTFTKGPFRESCGKHFFNGIDVSPFYLRKELDHTQPLFVAVNNLRRWITRMSLYGPKDRLTRSLVAPPELWDLYVSWYKLVPRRLRKFRGPDGYGDSFLIGNFEEVLPSKAKHGVEGWVVQTMNLLSVLPSDESRRVEGPSLTLKSFYRLDKKMAEVEGANSDEIAERLRTPLYLTGNTLVLNFPELAFGQY